MLSLSNIVIHYGGVQALKGISLEVEEGAITCLIGANGAGKSTTLKAISGLVQPTSGEIWFQGRRIDGMEPEEIVEMGIGHVPEGKKLFLEMNVQDNLMTGAYLRHGKEIIEQDLKRVYSYFPALGAAINRPASTMSGGEQQMLAIGRGLMCAPKLLMLDEPSLGLSPILTREVGAIIKRIADEGVSILLIEQNANLALQLARKCYVLETGKIALEGTSDELQNNEHVKAAYLGLCATADAPEAVISSGRVKNRDLPDAEPDAAGDGGWQYTKVQDPEPESRTSESQLGIRPASGVAVKAAGGPAKIQTDLGFQYGSNHGGSVSGSETPDRWRLDVGKPATKKEDTFTRVKRNSSRNGSPRVVKRVFKPKQK
jgi:branched-chain amino acid transport system ATP-binding protein